MGWDNEWNRQLPRSTRHYLLGSGRLGERVQRQALSPAEMAQSGLQMMAPSTTSLTGPSPPFAQEVVFQVIKSHPCWKTAPGTCGWEWMTDCICSRTGDSVLCLNRVTSRLDW